MTGPYSLCGAAGRGYRKAQPESDEEHMVGAAMSVLPALLCPSVDC